MLLLGVIIEYAANSLDRPFSYAYFGDKEIVKGVRVLVPFATTCFVRLGIISSLTSTSSSITP